MARPLDPPRRPGSHLIEAAAPRSVDAGEAEDVRRQAASPVKIEPPRFGGDASAAALGGGSGRRRLGDHGAAGIAVDAGRGQIADPAQAGVGDEVAGMLIEHGIAPGIGRHRDDDVGHPGERRYRIGERPVAVEEVDAIAQRSEPALLRFVTAGAGHSPAFGKEASRQGFGTVAEAEAEQVRHAADHRRCQVVALVVVVPAPGRACPIRCERAV